MDRFKIWSGLMRPRVEYMICDDISNGREFNKIPAFSYRQSDEAPGDYHYVTDHIQQKLAAHIDTSFQSMHSCACSGSCEDGKCNCSSHCKSGRYYNTKGRLSSTYNLNNPGIIYECNSACKCNRKTCINSVIQRGTRAKFALFRTKSRGWGVRAIEDIKKGTFLGVYSGELITVSDSSTRIDDTYLFNLGSTPPKISQCEPTTTTTTTTTENNQLQAENNNASENNYDSVQGQTNQQQNQEFVCDAKFYGNFTRFINHSCAPNVTGIRAYTNHYDKRFPHIAFFANQHITASSELTLNYGDNYWLVKCRRDNLFCLCKQSKCRFNKKNFANTYKQSELAHQNNKDQQDLVESKNQDSISGYNVVNTTTAAQSDNDNNNNSDNTDPGLITNI